MPKKPEKQAPSSSNREAMKAARTAANKARKAASILRMLDKWLKRKTTPRGTARAKRRLHLQPVVEVD